MTDLFWKICDVIAIMQPELGRAYNKEEVDVTGMNLSNLDEMMDILRFNAVYTMFDLEACRRDMVKLVNIIKSNQAQEGGESHGT